MSEKILHRDDPKEAKVMSTCATAAKNSRRNVPGSLKIGFLIEAYFSPDQT